MDGLPKDFDGTFLVGRTLQMVCFAAHQVYLHFDSDIMITIEGSFRHDDSDVTEVPTAHSDLMRLLELVVSHVHWEPDGTLKLLFQDGQSLIIHGSEPAYESYSITSGGRTIYV